MSSTTLLRIAAVVYAALLSVVTVYVVVAYDLPAAYVVAQPIILASAWIGVWAWFAKRWFLASACLVVTVLAPWGYLYVGPLVALVLAAYALWKGFESRRDRDDVPEQFTNAV